MSQLGAVMALLGARRHGGHFVVLILLVVIVVALVTALIRRRGRHTPVRDDWKPPVDPEKGPDA